MDNYGLISKIQRFSLGDGPGIRSTVFTQGCNMRCPWCHNPETIPKDGVVLLYENLCGKCGTCKKACLEQIMENCRISDRKKCTLCGRCETVCPNGAIVVSGKRMSMEDVFDYIAEDMPYYTESGGGITVSGGEPLLQADFCAALAEKCSTNGINVIIDTAGNVPFSSFESLIPFTNCFYFDIKTDIAGYVKIYGNKKIINDNLVRLSGLCDVVVRIPVIPGFNDQDSVMEAISNELSGIKIKEVHLLPFHRLASGKYRALELKYVFAETEPCTDIDKIKKIFVQKQIKCEEEG